MQAGLQESPPPLLYSYNRIDDYLRESLLLSQIWVSSPLNFNDPFDCGLPILKSRSAEKVKAFVNEHLRHANLPESDETLIRAMAEQGVIVEEDRIIELFRTLLRNVGVRCFSAIHDDILMWSHYASNHKGLCLGFDTQFDVFRDAQEVNYSTELPRLDLTDLAGETAIITITKALLTKSKHWAYEKEWRFVRTGPGFPGEQFSGEKDNFRRTIYDPQALKVVIFGCRIEPSRRAEIQRLLARRCSNIQYYQAETHASKFALVFRKLG